ncbi:HD-GYP domain-containing protein [Streptomyces sp. NPDC057654]|uniref:HD-GYP domain-containing protein n=1 Tax=Streptomyces sp. NPDC057654 TaxID=3346196 RepID=UPI0036A7BC88
MRTLPATARAYILCVMVTAALCAAPASRYGHAAPWATALALAALYALCERLTRRPPMGPGAPTGAGAFFPVLLAAAFLLPPPLAGLVAVPGALAAPVEREPARVRRMWHAARLSLAAHAASHVFALGAHRTVTAPDFPYVLLPAAAAALAFAVVSAALDIGILVTAERGSPRTAWRAPLLGSLAPHLVHGLAGLMMAILWHSTYGPAAALLVLLPMYISCWVFAQYHRERAAHQATIRALVQAVDIKDRYTRGHSERVGRASVLIARELGMDDDRLEALRFAGILHDVGKLGVPTRLLRKNGPLTPQERRVIELHPEYGHEMVRGIGFLDEARAAILHHHERLDGSGYPYGLSGRHIPLFARVVAVADAFDAMTSTRSYRRGRPVPAAVEELRRCAGTQFDPLMVGALARALDRHGWHPAVTADAVGETVDDLCGNVPSEGCPGPSDLASVVRRAGSQGDGGPPGPPGRSFPGPRGGDSRDGDPRGGAR